MEAEEISVIAVAAGGSHSLAAREDGSVLAWGLNDFGQTNAPTLANAIAVAAGNKHSLALRDNGTVVAWGRNSEDQTTLPSGLTNVIAVAAKGNQSMALLSNGAVTNWGNTFGTIPTDLTNATAIAAGTNFCLALRSDGTVLAWGNNDNRQTNVPNGLTNVVAIAAGDFHGMALKVDGTVTNWGLNTSFQTNAPSGLSNVMAIAAGRAHSVALKNDGTVVAWGDNSMEQTNIGAGLQGIKLIAAGGDHTLASAFSSTVQYVVDVSKDLLLIYNTNSTDSSNVWFYYMQHRPMVSSANVLRISCTSSEIITSNDLTTQIVVPITNWLALNPTKRPQYIVMFKDMPIRVNTGTNHYPTVGVQMRSLVSGWRPFVNHINLVSTNDCIAYIDKLSAFASSNSPGKLVISASSYNNPNYVVDDVHDGNGYSYSGTNIVTALAGLGIASANIIYSTDLYAPPGGHILTATNVAGYFSFGGHSYLGAAFAVNGNVKFYGNSAWYVITTFESGNGRLTESGLSCFGDWFAANAFGGTNYTNTPVGAAGNADECGCVPDAAIFMSFWAGGKNLAISAWSALGSPFAVAVGDPLTRK